MHPSMPSLVLLTFAIVAETRGAPSASVRQDPGRGFTSRAQAPDEDASAQGTIELEERVLEAPCFFARDPWRTIAGPLSLGGRVFALEEGANGECLGVDTDGDGCIDRTVERGSEIVSFELDAECDEGETASTRYWVRIQRSGRQWRWTPVGLRVGEFRGTRLGIVDSSGNGRFTDIGQDALLVGSSQVATPLSRVVAIGGELYALELEPCGHRARVGLYAGPRARLDVTSRYASKGELLAAVFGTSDGCTFDLAAEDVLGLPPQGGWEIPAGEYRLIAGLVGGRGETARIGPGSMPSIVLLAGERRVLSWGGPLRADFDLRRCGGKLTVLPDVAFEGQAGESYLAFHPVAGAPLIEVRERISGVLLQYGQFGGCCGGGLSACVLEVPAAADIDVQLVHERALFGRIVGAPRR